MSQALPDTPFALFDDTLAAGGDLLLSGLRERLVCADGPSLPSVLAAIERARADGCWLALSLHYELGGLLEPRLSHIVAGAGPLLTAWVFERAEQLAAADTAARIAATLAPLDEHRRHAGVADLAPVVSEQRYLDDVRRIREWIAAGDCYQVNYTFQSRGRLYGEPLALYARLRESQPVRYGAYIADRGASILSRSPELFVERRGERLTCKPMKGTAPRSADPAALLASEKEQAENLMIVDLIRNDLGRLVAAGGVRVERLFEVEEYRSLWQMTSTVVAEPVGAGLGDILRALFPCGSVTGAPKIRAMEIIRELEGRPRGVYCGGLGWLAPGGDFRLSVPIRTLVADAAGDVALGLGSGIVHDSVPASEWQECLLKGRFVTGLDPGFRLIETLRREPAGEAPYPLLEHHLARLRRSAACLGFALDESAVRERLAALTPPSPDAAARVRLTLGHDGDVELTAVALDGPADPAPASVVLSPHRLDSRDLLLRHKTTARSLYDAELARATAGGHFDALFENERGELCEGARSNLFLRVGGELLTPPLESGVLDGVLRRSLIESGAAREAVLRRADLTRAETVLMGNAVRGLVAVSVAGMP